MKHYKFSKTYIAAFMYRFAFLLFVPFLQGLLFAHEGAQRLFTIYSADLAVAVFLLSVAVIRCKNSCVSFNLKSKSLSVSQGAVIKTSATALSDFKGSVSVTEGLFLRLFKGSRLRIFAGTAYSTAYLKRKDAREILESVINEKKTKVFSSGIFRSLIMSLSFSNALTGLLAAVPVIRKVSVLIGARQTALLLEGASLEGLLGFTGLPPMLSRISSVLFLCWIIGFASEFFAEYGLKFSIFSSHFEVRKGLITKTRAVFPKTAVRAMIFKQSLLMFLLGFYSAEINLNIRPRRKIHILSAAGSTRCADLEEVLSGKKGERLLYVSPPGAAQWGYTYLPILLLSISSLGLIFFSQNLIIKTVLGILSGIFAVWFLFRTVALYRSSLSVWRDFAEVKYFSGMNFTRTVFKLSDITRVELSQSIFQKANGRCNLTFIIGNTKALKVKIKHLRKKDLENL